MGSGCGEWGTEREVLGTGSEAWKTGSEVLGTSFDVCGTGIEVWGQEGEIRYGDLSYVLTVKKEYQTFLSEDKSDGNVSETVLEQVGLFLNEEKSVSLLSYLASQNQTARYGGGGSLWM